VRAVITGPCRFEPSLPCSGPFTLSVSDCNDEFRGPVDLSKDEKRGGVYPTKREPKPAAPETREEAKTMAQGIKGTTRPTGKCDRCGKDGRKLGASRHAPGKRLCLSCSVRAYKLSKKGEALDAPGKAPAAAKAKSAEPSKALAKIDQQRPTAAPSATFSPLTARSLADALQAKVVTLQVTCRSVAAVLAVVRAVESDQDVMIGCRKG